MITAYITKQITGSFWPNSNNELHITIAPDDGSEVEHMQSLCTKDDIDFWLERIAKQFSPLQSVMAATAIRKAVANTKGDFTLARLPDDVLAWAQPIDAGALLDRTLAALQHKAA